MIGPGTKTRDAAVLASLVAAGLAWCTGIAISVMYSGDGGLHDHIVGSYVIRRSERAASPAAVALRSSGTVC